MGNQTSLSRSNSREVYYNVYVSYCGLNLKCPQRLMCWRLRCHLVGISGGDCITELWSYQQVNPCMCHNLDITGRWGDLSHRAYWRRGATGMWLWRAKSCPWPLRSFCILARKRWASLLHPTCLLRCTASWRSRKDGSHDHGLKALKPCTELNLSSFKLLLSGMCHSHKNLTNTDTSVEGANQKNKADNNEQQRPQSRPSWRSLNLAGNMASLWTS
jgi:hypothetical protein